MGSIAVNPLSRDVLPDLAARLKKQTQDQVQAFVSRTHDLAKETIDDARFIGNMRPNQNQLNVFSLLSKDDEQDYYRFSLKTTGKVHMGMLTDQLDEQRKIKSFEMIDALHVQLIRIRGKSQTVVADSDPKAGAANKSFQQFSGEGLTLGPDKYVVKVSRYAGTPSGTEFSYSLQLGGDRHYQEYDTLDSEAPAKKLGLNRIDVLSRDPVVGILSANPLFNPNSTMPVAGWAARTLAAGAGSGENPAVTMLGQFVNALF